jgi:hypothetical protein
MTKTRKTRKTITTRTKAAKENDNDDHNHNIHHIIIIIIIIIIIMKQEYNRRVRMILKSELNARNKITATGALAVLVLRYSFGIINWRTEDIKKN